MQPAAMPQEADSHASVSNEVERSTCQVFIDDPELIVTDIDSAVRGIAGHFRLDRAAGAGMDIESAPGCRDLKGRERHAETTGVFRHLPGCRFHGGLFPSDKAEILLECPRFDLPVQR